MSINPVLARDSSAGNELCPMPQPGEVFILKRDGISFVASNSAKKLTGKGKVFLTSRRLVFLRDGDSQKHQVFSSVELPLHMMRGATLQAQPAFKQPIFGANYLEGKIEADEHAQYPLATASNWSITFNKGGCQAFLQAFYRLHKHATSDLASATTLASQMCQQMGPGSQAAFVDPSDPTNFYTAQPVASQLNPGSPQHYQQNQSPSSAATAAAAPLYPSLDNPHSPSSYHNPAASPPIYHPQQGGMYQAQQQPPYGSPHNAPPNSYQALPQYQPPQYQQQQQQPYQAQYQPYQPPPAHS